MSSSRPALRRLCACCGSRVVYAWRLVGDVSCRNRRDGDYPVRLGDGATLCGPCVRHNDIESTANPLPPAHKRKRCHRCSGSGRIANPTLHLVLHGRHPEVPLRRRAKYWKCPTCLGRKEVAA